MNPEILDHYLGLFGEVQCYHSPLRFPIMVSDKVHGRIYTGLVYETRGSFQGSRYTLHDTVNEFAMSIADSMIYKSKELILKQNS